MDETKAKEIIEDIVNLAVKVLPSAIKSKDPTERLMGAMGAIPDTAEWAVMKLSFLEPDDYKGIAEWQEYVIEKANEYCKIHGVA